MTDKFFEGFKRFKTSYFGDDSALYASMKEGQPAKTLMIACSDSRVDPAILTDCDPGDLFTVRNVANLVPPCESHGDYHGTSSALEFAVNHLKVENIIIMGHANCGGIKALWDDDGSTQSQFIHPWVRMAERAKRRVKATMSDLPASQQLKACEQEAVLESLQNLLTFPWIAEKVEAGTLRLHGWYFDLAEGELLNFDPKSKQFKNVI